MWSMVFLKIWNQISSNRYYIQINLHHWRSISRKNAPQKESKLVLQHLYCEHIILAARWKQFFHSGLRHGCQIFPASHSQPKAEPASTTFNCSRGCCCLASARYTLIVKSQDSKKFVWPLFLDPDPLMDRF